LEEIDRAMDSVTSQKDLSHFLKNPENAQKVNGLVEDVRHALMNYQVRTPGHSLASYLTSTADVVTTGHLRRGLSADREPYSLIVPSLVMTCE